MTKFTEKWRIHKMIGSDILLSIIGVECLENLKLSKLFILWILKFYILNIELHLITKEQRFMGFLINMTSLGRFPKKAKKPLNCAQFSCQREVDQKKSKLYYYLKENYVILLKKKNKTKIKSSWIFWRLVDRKLIS